MKFKSVKLIVQNPAEKETLVSIEIDGGILTPGRESVTLQLNDPSDASNRDPNPIKTARFVTRVYEENFEFYADNFPIEFNTFLRAIRAAEGFIEATVTLL